MGLRFGIVYVFSAFRVMPAAFRFAIAKYSQHFGEYRKVFGSHLHVFYCISVGMKRASVHNRMCFAAFRLLSVSLQESTETFLGAILTPFALSVPSYR